MWDFDFFLNSIYLFSLWFDEVNWKILNYSINYWLDLIFYWLFYVLNIYVEYRRFKKGFFSFVFFCYIKFLDT